MAAPSFSSPPPIFLRVVISALMSHTCTLASPLHERLAFEPLASSSKHTDGSPVQWRSQLSSGGTQHLTDVFHHSPHPVFSALSTNHVQDTSVVEISVQRTAAVDGSPQNVQWSELSPPSPRDSYQHQFASYSDNLFHSGQSEERGQADPLIGWDGPGHSVYDSPRWNVLDPGNQQSEGTAGFPLLRNEGPEFDLDRQSIESSPTPFRHLQTASSKDQGHEANSPRRLFDSKGLYSDDKVEPGSIDFFKTPSIETTPDKSMEERDKEATTTTGDNGRLAITLPVISYKIKDALKYVRPALNRANHRSTREANYRLNSLSFPTLDFSSTTSSILPTNLNYEAPSDFFGAVDSNHDRDIRILRKMYDSLNEFVPRPEQNDDYAASRYFENTNDEETYTSNQAMNEEDGGSAVRARSILGRIVLIAQRLYDLNDPTTPGDQSTFSEQADPPEFGKRSIADMIKSKPGFTRARDRKIVSKNKNSGIFRSIGSRPRLNRTREPVSSRPSNLAEMVSRQPSFSRIRGPYNRQPSLTERLSSRTRGRGRSSGRTWMGYRGRIRGSRNPSRRYQPAYLRTDLPLVQRTYASAS